jgi:NitT/TauT family transport system substrate-binding protein
MNGHIAARGGLFGLIVLLAACGGAAPAASTPAPSGKASVAAGASAQPLSLNTIRYSIGTASGSQVLPDVALAAGYFKEEGLNVSVIRLNGGPETLAALTKGDTDMSNTDAPGSMQAHMNGVPTVIVAVPITKPIFDVMAAPSITRPEDLKGKTAAVTRIGDSTYFQFSLALRSWGLKPNEDVKITALSDYPGIFAAMANGQVSAAPMAAPFNFQAKKQGFHSLADLSQLPINYPTNSVQTTQKFAADHPDTIKAFLRAYVKGIQRFKHDEAFSTNLYRTFLKSEDTELIQQTWAQFSKLVNDDPTPTKEGMQFVLDNLGGLGDAKAKTADPNEFINTSFMEDLKASGALKP